MKKLFYAIPALLIAAYAWSQPVPSGGLMKVIHDATCTGNGTNGSPLSCAGGGGGISGLTTNKVPKATSGTTIGDSTISDPGLGTVTTSSEISIARAAGSTPLLDFQQVGQTEWQLYGHASANTFSLWNSGTTSDVTTWDNAGNIATIGAVQASGAGSFSALSTIAGHVDVFGTDAHTILNWTGSTTQDSYLRAGKTAGVVNIGDINTGGVNIGATGNATTINGSLTSIAGPNTLGETEDNMTAASNSSGTLTDISFDRTKRGVWWTWSGAGTLDGMGFTAGTPTDGQHFMICVIGAGSLTLAHENAGETTVGRRFNFFPVAPTIIRAGACRDMIYDNATARWRAASNAITASNTLTANVLLKGNTNLSEAGPSGITDNATTVTIAAAENLSSAYTGAQPATIVATYSGTSQAADHYAVQATNSGTYNTTAAGRSAYGVNATCTNSISSGANTLTSVCGYFTNSSSGANINAWALVTDVGDVKLNSTSGSTQAAHDFSVTGATTLNNTAAGTGTTLTASYTSTAQAADRFVAQLSNTGTFDATAAVRTAYGAQISSTATRSAGANTLTDIALDITASGAQTNVAVNTKDGDVKFNQASGNVVVGGASNNPHLTFTDNSQRPTIANCGTTAPTVVGTDTSGWFITATGITNACAITFHTAFSANIDCNSWLTGAGTQVIGPALTIATGSLTFAASGGGALGTGLKVHWFCDDH